MARMRWVSIPIWVVTPGTANAVPFFVGALSFESAPFCASYTNSRLFSAKTLLHLPIAFSCYLWYNINVNEGAPIRERYIKWQ